MSKDNHWLNNSVVSRISRGPGLESRSGRDFFFPWDIWWLTVDSRLGQRASKCASLVVPSRFGTGGGNLITQGGVKGRPSGSVAQLAEFSHGKRETLGSSPGRDTILFSFPVTLTLLYSFTNNQVVRNIGKQENLAITDQSLISKRIILKFSWRKFYIRTTYFTVHCTQEGWTSWFNRI